MLDLLERRYAAGSPEPAVPRLSVSPDARGGQLRQGLADTPGLGRGLPRSQSALPAFNRSYSDKVELPERSRSVLDRPFGSR